MTGRRRRGENPDYGPGNADYEYDAWRQRQVDDEAEAAAQAGAQHADDQQHQQDQQGEGR